MRALVANDMHEEAYQVVDDHIQDPVIAMEFKAMVAAQKGDQDLFEQLTENYEAEESVRNFWHLIVNAWGGNRDEANRLAARIDQHHFSPVTLTQIVLWCGCGAP